ncbi:MAG: 16S rRNA (cytosine(1402)-N(4))-methyltransferase RsmH [Anaerolineales bacterium]
MNSPPHISVLPDEVLASLRAGAVVGGLWADGTLGAGGHTAALLAAHPAHRVIATDRDAGAIATARARLAADAERLTIHHASYEALPGLLAAQGLQPDGIVLDLGLSSMQLDTPERGFAFRLPGALDMRFDATAADHPTAAMLVNTWPERDLADLLYQYGEERDSRRIAAAIVRARPIHDTQALAEVIAGASRTPPHQRHIHPATRSFQALRIAVNDELGTLERALNPLIDCLKPGGRLAVISFHSLEDRIVKEIFKDAARDHYPPPEVPVQRIERPARARLITRKPVTPSAEEIAANSRARSAKLRVLEKLPPKEMA